MVGSLKAKKKKGDKRLQSIKYVHLSMGPYCLVSVQGFGSPCNTMLTYSSVFNAVIKTEHYADIMDNNNTVDVGQMRQDKVN